MPLRFVVPSVKLGAANLLRLPIDFLPAELERQHNGADRTAEARNTKPLRVHRDRFYHLGVTHASLQGAVPALMNLAAR